MKLVITIVTCIMLTSTLTYAGGLDWDVEVSIMKNLQDGDEEPSAESITKAIKNTKKLKVKNDGKDHTIYKDKNIECFYHVTTNTPGAESLAFTCKGSAVVMSNSHCVLIDGMPEIRNFNTLLFMDVKNDVTLSLTTKCGLRGL